MDPKNINWRLVGAVLAGLGYIAWRNKGFGKFGRALEKNAVIAGVLAVVAYFGLGFVLGQVKAVQMPGGAAPAGDLDMPPETGQLSGYMPQQQMQQPHQMGQVARGPGGMELTEPFGC